MVVDLDSTTEETWRMVRAFFLNSPVATAVFFISGCVVFGLLSIPVLSLFGIDPMPLGSIIAAVVGGHVGTITLMFYRRSRDTLEQKVMQRTQELAEANERLRQENERLRLEAENQRLREETGSN